MLSKTGVKLGVALPQGFSDGNTDLGLLRTYAQQAEAAGYDDVWTIEQITGRFPVLEPVACLSFVSAITDRVRLGTAVLVVNLRSPIQLAKELATVDGLSGGRITVGIGLGVNTRMYPAFGLTEQKRVARFMEGVRVMKALWTQDAARFEGDYFRLDGVAMEPKPLQKPNPPLWFGAHTEAAQRRAARHGDGWMGAGSTDLGDFFDELARMRDILKQEGRDESPFPLSKRVYISVNQDESRARADMQVWLKDFYGRPDVVDSWAVCGSPARCLETLHRMREAGLSHFMLHPVPTTLGHLETLTSRVAPEL
jgi:probable F420-dependent oxidoreductase